MTAFRERHIRKGGAQPVEPASTPGTSRPFAIRARELTDWVLYGSKIESSQPKLIEERRKLFQQFALFWENDDTPVGKTRQRGLNRNLFLLYELKNLPIHVRGNRYEPAGLVSSNQRFHNCVLVADRIGTEGERNEVILKVQSDLNARQAAHWRTMIDSELRKASYYMQRSINEIAVLHTLNGLHAPKLLDAQFIANPDNPDQRILAFATEQAEGRDMEHYMRQVNPYANAESTARFVKMFRTTLYGLKDIHEKGVIHMDFKPPHIFLTADGEKVTFIDFGLSVQAGRIEAQRTLQESADSASSGVKPSYAYGFHNISAGTEGYLSESDAQGPDFAQDIYAVGKCFRKWLGAHRAQQQVPPSIQVINGIINEMIKEERSGRISADAAVAQLEGIFV